MSYHARMFSGTLEIRRVGRRAALVKKPLTVRLRQSRSITAADLIAAVVRQEVAAFKLRQADNLTLRALTEAEISTGIARGALKPPQPDAIQKPLSQSRSVKTAQQAFYDGLFYLFVDGVQIETNAAPVALKTGSTVMFLRLVALSGG